MMRTPVRRAALLVAGIAIVVVVWFAGPIVVFHALPSQRIAEADRLVSTLGLGPGHTVGEIGAGSGWLAAEMATRVGPGGRVYATEITPEKRGAIADTGKGRGLANLHVLEAGEHDPGLPPECCDAVYMRNVLHHIDDWPAYTRTLAPVLKAGGRIAIIDFAPGALLYLAGDHGVEPDEVVAAFASAGFEVDRRVDDWGGAMYLLVFRRAPPATSE